MLLGVVAWELGGVLHWESTLETWGSTTSPCGLWEEEEEEEGEGEEVKGMSE